MNRLAMSHRGGSNAFNRTVGDRSGSYQHHQSGYSYRPVPDNKNGFKSERQDATNTNTPCRSTSVSKGSIVKNNEDSCSSNLVEGDNWWRCRSPSTASQDCTTARHIHGTSINSNSHHSCSNNSHPSIPSFPLSVVTCSSSSFCTKVAAAATKRQQHSNCTSTSSNDSSRRRRSFDVAEPQYAEGDAPLPRLPPFPLPQYDRSSSTDLDYHHHNSNSSNQPDSSRNNNRPNSSIVTSGRNSRDSNNNNNSGKTVARRQIPVAVPVPVATSYSDLHDADRSRLLRTRPLIAAMGALFAAIEQWGSTVVFESLSLTPPSVRGGEGGLHEDGEYKDTHTEYQYEDYYYLSPPPTRCIASPSVSSTSTSPGSFPSPPTSGLRNKMVAVPGGFDSLVCPSLSAEQYFNSRIRDKFPCSAACHLVGCVYMIRLFVCRGLAIDQVNIHR